MREKLKAGYYLMQKMIGRQRRLLDRIRRENAVVVLNLHQVSPHRNPFWAPLEPRLFDDLLGFIKRHFEVVTFGDLREASGDKPRAVLSFDDGYYNFVEYAVPLLEKHALRANMNVVVACVETGEPMWNIKLYDFLNAAPRALIDEIRLPGFETRLKGDGDGDKIAYGLSISRFLKNRPRREREELWAQLEPVMQRMDFPLTRMMTAAEIREISGVHEIGAHSYSHESMQYEETSFFEEDLDKCARYFEETLRLPLDIYAFPNGSYRDEQIKLLEQRGVRHILLVGEDYARADRNVYPRFTIYGASALETRFQGLGFNKKS